MGEVNMMVWLALILSTLAVCVNMWTMWMMTSWDQGDHIFMRLSSLVMLFGTFLFALYKILSVTWPQHF